MESEAADLTTTKTSLVVSYPRIANRSLGTSTLEARYAERHRPPLPHDLQARGYRLLETVEGLGMEQQLNLACRTLLATLLLRRSNPGAAKVRRDAFKTVCAEVQLWLRDEIAAIRRVKRAPKAALPTRVLRPKVGHV